MSFQDDYLIVLFLFALWFGFRPFQNENAGSKRQIDSALYYKTLAEQAPPGLVFGIVWPILYGLIVAAHFLYWTNGSDDTVIYGIVLILYMVNLLLNKLWSPMFFAEKNPQAALVIIILTELTAIVIAILMAVDHVWSSFWLLVPYILWLAYATYLNVTFIGALERAGSTPVKVIRQQNRVDFLY